MTQTDTDKEILLLSIGERLKELRKQKGYTSYETFANDIDMTRSQYWKYENGKTNISVFTLTKILLHLNISLKDFFSKRFG